MHGLGEPDRGGGGGPRIAVLRSSALGDLVFALPALQALRDRYLEAHVTLLGGSWQREFLEQRPGLVDEVAVVPGVPGVTVPAGAAESADFVPWLEAQRGAGYDLAVQLHDGGRFSNPLVASLGAGLTIGAQAPDAAPLDRTVPYVYLQHEVARLLEVVGLVGAAAPPHPRLAATDAERAAASRLHLPRRYCVLHPGANDPRRRWSAGRFAEVAEALTGRGVAVVLTGARREQELTARVSAASPAIDLAGRLSLTELVGVLAGAALVVANDTGPLHLAAALGSPTVGIYWIGHLLNSAPLERARHRPLVSWTVRCPQCGADGTREAFPARTGGTACRHSASFVDEVPVAEVLAAADELLAGA